MFYDDVCKIIFGDGQSQIYRRDGRHFFGGPAAHNIYLYSKRPRTFGNRRQADFRLVDGQTRAGKRRCRRIRAINRYYGAFREDRGGD